MAESNSQASTSKPTFYGHSNQLFTRSNGNSINFSMRPCGERVEIKGMIEHGGGVISAEITKNCIRLAKTGSVVIDSRTVDSRYVYECVKENRLLDLDKFYLVRAESSSSDSDHQYLASAMWQREKKTPTKRKEFTYEDDVAILDFICKNNYHADIGGNVLWKNMEKLKILKGRTWHSLSNRFKKTIRNRLANYNISKGDKFLLEKKTETNKNVCWQNRCATNSVKRNIEPYESDDSEEKRDESDLTLIEEEAKTDITLPKSPLAGVRRLPLKNQVFLEAGPSNEWVGPRKRKVAESPPATTSKPPVKKWKKTVIPADPNITNTNIEVPNIDDQIENSVSSTPELELSFVEEESSQTLIKVREKLVDVQQENIDVSKSAKEVREIQIENEVLASPTEIRENDLNVLEKVNVTEVRGENAEVRSPQTEVPTTVNEVVETEVGAVRSETEVLEEIVKVRSPQTEVPKTVNEVGETEVGAVRSEIEVPEEIVDNGDEVEVRVNFLNMRRKEVKEYMVEEMRKKCGGKISDELFLSLISGTSKLHLVEMIEKDSPRRFDLLDSVPGYLGNPSDNDSFEEFF